MDTLKEGRKTEFERFSACQKNQGQAVFIGNREGSRQELGCATGFCPRLVHMADPQGWSPTPSTIPLTAMRRMDRNPNRPATVLILLASLVDTAAYSRFG